MHLSSGKDQSQRLFTAFSAVDLTKDKEMTDSRLYFRPTRRLSIWLTEADGDNRFYGVGHFDVIIYDEIHQCV